MNLKPLVRKTQRFLRKNLSHILSAAGIACVVATAVSSSDATAKCYENNLSGHEARKAYLPTAIFMLGAIASIVSADVANSKKQACLVAAYSFLEKSYANYRKQVECDGKYSIEKQLPRMSELAELSKATEQYYDFYLDEYFNANRRQIDSAEEYANDILNTEGYLSFNDMCEYMGLGWDPFYAYMGWDAKTCPELKISKQKVIMDDGMECTILSYNVDPSLEC